jgi:hypothetical protein
MFCPRIIKGRPSRQAVAASREGALARVSSGNPSEEGIGECNRVDVHCRKDRRMYEERRNKAHVPIQPREQESSKKNLLKNRDEQTAAKNRDHPGGRTLAL